MGVTALHDVLVERAVLRGGKPMVALRYVGAKPSKTDTVCGSKQTWRGPGDVQEVPLATAKKLLRYPEVWALPEEPWEPPARPADPGAESELLGLVEAGDWAAIERQWPEVFERAMAWFEQALTQPEPEAVEPAGDERRLSLAVPDADDMAWVRTVIAGNRDQIRESLQADGARLLANPDLYEELIKAERLGKARQSVVELFMSFRDRDRASLEQAVAAGELEPVSDAA